MNEFDIGLVGDIRLNSIRWKVYNHAIINILVPTPSAF